MTPDTRITLFKVCAAIGIIGLIAWATEDDLQAWAKIGTVIFTACAVVLGIKAFRHQKSKDKQGYN